MRNPRTARLVAALAAATLLAAATPEVPKEATVLETAVVGKKAFKAALQAISDLELEVTAKQKPGYLQGRRGFDRVVKLVPTIDGFLPTGQRTIETVQIWFETSLDGSTRIHLRADTESRNLDAGKVGEVTGGGRAEALERELRTKLEKLL